MGSGQNSNSSKLLCMFLIPASMKRIQRQVLMYVIITCKYEKDPIKNNQKSGNTVFQTITLSVAMETSGQLLPNFKLIQAFMHVLIACKYEKDQMKNSGENVMTSFSPL